MHRTLVASLVPMVLGCGGLLYDDTRFDDVGTVVCDGVRVQVGNERHLRAFPHLDEVHRPHFLVTVDGATDAQRMDIRLERFPYDWPPSHPYRVAGSEVTWSEESLHNLKDVVQIDMDRPPGDPVAEAAASCGEASFDAFKALIADHPAFPQAWDFQHVWWFGGTAGPVFRGPEGEITVSFGVLMLWPAEGPPLQPGQRRSLKDQQMRALARIVGEVEREAQDRWAVLPDEDSSFAELAQYVDERGIDLVSAYGLNPDGTQRHEPVAPE